MSISYEGIGAWCATFAAGTGAEEGKVVKVSGGLQGADRLTAAGSERRESDGRGDP